MEICLQEIETIIPRETLVFFESDLWESTCHGETEDTSLFNLWKTIRQEVVQNKCDVPQKNTKENYAETNNNNVEQKTTSPTDALQNYNLEN